MTGSGERGNRQIGRNTERPVYVGLAGNQTQAKEPYFLQLPRGSSEPDRVGSAFDMR
jgi:hypothetical protein